MFRIYNLWCQNKSYQGIGSQSVFLIDDLRTANIFVNASVSHICWVNLWSSWILLLLSLRNWLGLPEIFERTWRFLFRYVKLLFKVFLYLNCPLRVLYLSLLENYIIKSVVSLFMKFVNVSQAMVKQTHKFNRFARSWCGRVTFIPSLYWRAHLVHPSQAVQLISSIDESSVLINSQLNIEPFSHHVRVNFVSSSPFSVINSVRVGLNDIMDDLFDSHGFCFTLLFHVIVFDHVIWKEQHVNFLLENLVVIRFTSILFHSSDEPPACISAIVSRIVSIVQQVGNHSMA